jgi:dTDP-4-amino-4,6-dideoxygalactose transaminase
MVVEFEKRLASFCGVKHAIAFSSGRAAFHALLDSLDYPPDSFVLTPSLNYPAMPLTVVNRGLNVAWIPMSEKHLAPDLEKAKAFLPGNARALVWPHYFGFPGPVDELLSFCREHGLDLIEDSAHSLGARYGGGHVGGFGRAAIFSFETSKIVNTFGGGMAITNDDELSQRLLEIRESLASPSKIDVSKGVLKSYLSAMATSRWGGSVFLYPALAVSRAAGMRDFVEERSQGAAPKSPTRLSGLQSRVGLAHMDRLSHTLVILKRQFLDIQNIIDSSGMGMEETERGCPSGFMTAGVCKDAGELSRRFFKRGIDIKTNYMRDCPDIVQGLGAERCNPISKRLFHVPNRTGFSESGFRKYITAIKSLFDDLDQKL